MIIMGDRKKTVHAILGEPERGEDNKPHDSLSAIAEDLIQAVKENNAPGVASALRAAHMECETKSEPEE